MTRGRVAPSRVGLSSASSYQSPRDHAHGGDDRVMHESGASQTYDVFYPYSDGRGGVLKLDRHGRSHLSLDDGNTRGGYTNDHYGEDHSTFLDDDSWDDDKSYYDGEPGDWYEPPSVERAEKHAEKTNPQHLQTKSVVGARPRDLREYGMGMVLYFNFIRTLAGTFFVLSVLYVPTILANLTGNALGQGDNPLAAAVETSSLGNYGPVWEWTTGPGNATWLGQVPSEQNATAWPPRSDSPWEHGKARKVRYITTQEKDDLNVGLMFFNLVFLSVFASFALGIGPASDGIAEEVDRNVTTVEDYTVQVSGIPEDVFDDDELWTFFGKTVGPVMKLQIAQNHGELLSFAAARDKVADRLNRALANVKKAREDPSVKESKLRAWEEAATALKMRLHACDAGIRALQEDRGGEGFRTLCAFVTFQNEEDFLGCLEMYRQGVLAWFFRPSHLRFRGKHRLKVKQAPPPDDIHWENLEYSWSQRLFRQINVKFFTFGILVLTFMAICGVEQLKSNTGTSYDEAECRRSCKYETEPRLQLIDPTIREQYSTCFNLEANGDVASTAEHCGPLDSFCYSCYCLELVTYMAVLRDKSYCAPYVEGYTMSLVAGGLAQFVIGLVNGFLTVYIDKVVRLEKHHSKSDEAVSIMRMLFVSQFLNTAMNLVVISAAVPWLKDFIKGSGVEGIMFEGNIEDLAPRWYTDVGYDLVLAMMVAPFQQRFATFVRWLNFHLGRKSAREKAVTQRELNQAYEGADFNLAVKYGEALNILFISMTFCAGLPILIPLGAVSFAVMYYVEKFDFLRVSRLPPRYGRALGRATVDVVAFAMIGHLGFAVWANSFYRMEPSAFINGIIGVPLETLCSVWGSLPAPLGNLFGLISDTSEVARRGLQKNVGWYTLLLFVYLAILVLRGIFALVTLALRETFPSTFAKWREPEDNPPFEIAVETRRMLGPTSYNLKDMPEYSAAYTKVAWEMEGNVIQ